MNLLDRFFKHEQIAHQVTMSALPGRVYSIAFSPNENSLAYGCCGITEHNGNLFISQVGEGSEIVSKGDPVDH